MSSSKQSASRSAILWTLVLAFLLSTTVKCSTLKRIGPDRFEQVLDKKPIAFVLFYDPRCWHCKQLIAKLKELKHDLQDNKVAIYLMNCRNHPRYIRDYDLKYFPSLSFFKEGELETIMPSHRAESVEGVAKWVNNKAGGHLTFKNHNTELARVSSGTCLISDLSTWFPEGHVSIMNRDLKYGTVAALALRGSSPVHSLDDHSVSLKTLSSAPSNPERLQV